MSDASAVLYNSPMARSSSLTPLTPSPSSLSPSHVPSSHSRPNSQASPMSPSSSKGPPSVFDDAALHAHPLTFYSHVTTPDNDHDDDVPECAGCKRPAITGYRCDLDDFVLCYPCSRTLRIAFRPSAPRQYGALFAAVPSLTTHELNASDLSPTTATRAITPTTAKAAAWLHRRSPATLPSMAESPPLSPSLRTTNSSSAGTSSSPSARTTSTEVDTTRSSVQASSRSSSRSTSCARVFIMIVIMIGVAALSSVSTILYMRSLARRSSVVHITDDIPSIITSSVQTAVLQATSNLGILDHLAAHPGASSEQLAMVASLHAASLHRLLNYLSTIQVVHATCMNDTIICDIQHISWWCVDNGMTLLSSDAMSWSLWLTTAPHINPRWTARITDMIRTGRNQARSDIDEWSPLGVVTRASSPAGDWTTTVDWSRFTSLVDVGVGGTAANGTVFDLLLPILQRHPNITGVLYRSDNGMRDNMKWFGEHHASLLRRTQFQGGHWSNGVPIIDQHHDGTSHAFVFNQVMHRVHDDDIGPLLTTVRTAMGRNMNARLFITDSFAPHEHDAHVHVSSNAHVWPLAITDMISLSYAGGGLRSHTSWLVALARCHYRVINTTTPDQRVNLHIMEAVPIASSSPVV